jgi:predicted O-methyltransferase YrrM
MNIQENITKFTNLEANDSLSAFQGHTAQQYHGAFEVFYNFIKDVKPKRILEIGTSLGGFTTFLKLSCNELNLDTDIRSYDINRDRKSVV